MNRILVIEPFQMLRHAFAVALSPEYQVETLADFPDETLLERADLVVVNAASLKTSEKLDGNKSDLVGAWKKPVIWIDTDAGAEANEFSQCFRLTWPVDRDGLRKAVASCLQASPAKKEEIVQRTKVTRPGPLKVQHSENSAASTDLGEKRLIELVDIVE
jgi:hypothetical protein